MDLALNNLQRLICHKTKPNQTKLQISLTFILPTSPPPLPLPLPRINLFHLHRSNTFVIDENL